MYKHPTYQDLLRYLAEKEVSVMTAYQAHRALPVAQ
jgi:hypothetical protein